MRHINPAGLELIKSFEGFRSLPYQDVSGKWTIGYGHTRGIASDAAPITEAEAEIWLRDDLSIAENAVSHLVNVPLTDNQFAALVSFVFNCGVEPLTHTLGKQLNAGDYISAAQEFTKWIYVAGVISPGLIHRRAAEEALFLTHS